MSMQSCQMCGGDLTLSFQGYPGYQAPQVFDIWYCADCHTAMADPLVSDKQLYDLIYAHLEQVPGYLRYGRYRQAVLRHRDPLDYLAQSEDTFWAIKQCLQDKSPQSDPKILEIGSGLGYLTYSIAAKGFDVVGLDVSQAAVDQANKVYGKYFVCGDVEQYPVDNVYKYHIVILTEVIEHVPDISSLLKAIDKLLINGGEVIVTTPDREMAAPNAIWNSDAPPVHLWWLSEGSFKFLARQLGYSVRFLDFTEYNKSHYQRLSSSKKTTHPNIVPSVFDQSGRRVINGNPHIYKIKRWARRSRLFGIVLCYYRVRELVLGRIQFFRLRNHPELLKRRQIICAILTKPN